jgi:hypothetical protein
MPTTTSIPAALNRPCPCGGHRFAVLRNVELDVRGLSSDRLGLTLACCAACGRLELFADDPGALVQHADAVVEVPAQVPYR